MSGKTLQVLTLDEVGLSDDVKSSLIVALNDAMTSSLWSSADFDEILHFECACLNILWEHMMSPRNTTRVGWYVDRQIMRRMRPIVLRSADPKNLLGWDLRWALRSQDVRPNPTHVEAGAWSPYEVAVEATNGSAAAEAEPHLATLEDEEIVTMLKDLGSLPPASLGSYARWAHIQDILKKYKI